MAAVARPVAAFAAAVLLATVAAAGADDLQRDEASGLQYLEIITGGAATTDPLPVVVAIHGLGDHPETFRLLLDDLPARARVIVPRAPMPHGEDGFSWFDFHVADDDEGARELSDGIREAGERLAQLLVSLAKRHAGPARSVVCGFSQGGMLSFQLAAAHPELLAVAIPVSGYLPSSLWPAERPKTRPLPKVFALHGETDRLIPVESARWTVEALRSNGYDATLRSWPGVGHALVPEVRATVVASVVSAVVELSPPGVALEGPPAPARFDLKPRVAVAPPPGEEAPDDFPPPAPPEFAEPSPLEEPAAPAH